MGNLKERIAVYLWHRFAPEHHMEWDEETHQAEYRDAAEGVLILCSPLGGDKRTLNPEQWAEKLREGTDFAETPFSRSELMTRDGETKTVETQTVAGRHLADLVLEYARNLRRNSSGGDNYPWEYAKGTADYLEELVRRAQISTPVAQTGDGVAEHPNWDEGISESRMHPHQVVQREVLDWANSLNGKPPIGEDLSRLIQALADAVEADRRLPTPAQPALETAPLRLCGYCKSWNSKPCGEGCCLSPTDPTIEKVRADDLKANQRVQKLHKFDRRVRLPLKGNPMSIEAMRKALNYIENTEGELGIKLSCGDALREALAAQPPAAPVETDAGWKFAKELSDALLKVRPLGGSELFVQRNGQYYADPHYCGQLIEQLNADHIQSIKDRVRAQKQAPQSCSAGNGGEE